MINSEFQGKSVFDFATDEELKEFVPGSMTKEMYLQESTPAQLAYDIAYLFEMRDDKLRQDSAMAYAESLPQTI